MQRNAVLVLSAAVAVLAISAVGGWSWRRGQQLQQTDWAPLCGDLQFTPSELAQMEAVLAQHGVTRCRIEDRRLLAPAELRQECLAALARGKALPQGLGSGGADALADASPFDSRQTREYKRKLALQQDLARVLTTMQGIVEATVKYDISPPSGLQQVREQRALAAVRLEAGRALAADQVVTIQHTIAASLVGLRPADVTVTDLNHCRTWTGETAAAQAGASPLAAAAAPTVAGRPPAHARLNAADQAELRTALDAPQDHLSTENLARQWQIALRQDQGGRFAEATVQVRWVASLRDIQPAPQSAAAADGAPGAANATACLQIQQPHLMAWIVMPRDARSDAELRELEAELRTAALAVRPPAWSRGDLRQTLQVAWRGSSPEAPTAALRREDPRRASAARGGADASATLTATRVRYAPGGGPDRWPRSSADEPPRRPATKPAEIGGLWRVASSSTLAPLCGVIAALGGVWCWLFRGAAEASEPAAAAPPEEPNHHRTLASVERPPATMRRAPDARHAEAERDVSWISP